jgi:hypothetical protein
MYGTIESTCFACRKALVFDKKPGRRDECPHCGAEVHVCKNCEFYDPRLTRGCREPQAEEVRDTERANFCNWFQLRKGGPADDQPRSATDAKAGFDALFGRGPKPEGDKSREAAKDAFDALFKKK